MTIKIFEPHPSAPQNTYIHSGRGGAGNLFKAPKTTSPSTAQGPASLFTHGLPSSRRPPKFSSGRGGAGNIHCSKEKEVYDFDEEMKRQLSRTATNGSDVVHVGRGGAGNWVWNNRERGERRKDSCGSETGGSEDGEGEGSGRRRSGGVLGRLSGVFERR